MKGVEARKTCSDCKAPTYSDIVKCIGAITVLFWLLRNNLLFVNRCFCSIAIMTEC